MLEPFQYQIEGAAFLASRRRGLLLDDPGTGKTLQAIKAADELDADDMGTICPASVVKQWGKAHGSITTRDNPLFSAYSYERARDKGLNRRPTVLCLDELHYLNNPDSGRTVKILGRERYGADGLIHNADYVWGMTGTWLTRDPSTLYPAMFAIIPGSLLLKASGNTMDYWQFMKKFCVYYDTGYGVKVTNGKNLSELKDRLAPFILRRTKKDVRKDWKEPMTAELWLDPEDAGDAMMQAELQPEAQEVAEVFKKGGFDALELLADTDRTGVSRYRRYCGLLKVLPVVKWLCGLFDGGLEKIVLICVHREVIEGLAAELAKQKIKSFIFYGGMSDTKKEAAKIAFIKAERGAFIGQIAAAGTGVDGLQEATGRMLFVEWSWKATDNQQALDRLDRIGQTEPVLGEFAAFEGSLDGAIMAVAARRAKMSKQLFG